ncbi:MAG TPA: antitoxin [Chloroflexota bacterium]|nr:antitoxin [Chloroflexota bacterium]
MVAQRLEVRLDPERRRKLAEITAFRGAPVSEVVRELIDRAYAEIDRAVRLRAAEELCAMEIEEVPDPEDLTRQLERKYELADLP